MAPYILQATPDRALRFLTSSAVNPEFIPESRFPVPSRSGNGRQLNRSMQHHLIS
jgi:hypothetical protein